MNKAYGKSSFFTVVDLALFATTSYTDDNF